MNTIIVHADSKVSKALVAIFKALNVSYEIKKENSKEESPRSRANPFAWFYNLKY